MKVLICGGREFNDPKLLFQIMDSFNQSNPISRVIHGNARGADQISGQWAISRKIPTLIYPANWEKFGKQAGFIRNSQMLTEGKPDLVVAFHGGSGTTMMCEIAIKAGIMTYRLTHDGTLLYGVNE